jgi:hypothetical protein
VNILDLNLAWHSLLIGKMQTENPLQTTGPSVQLGHISEAIFHEHLVDFSADAALGRDFFISVE